MTHCAGFFFRGAAVYYGLSLVMITAAALAGASTAVAATIPLIVTILILLVVTREGRHRSGWASLGLHNLGMRTWPLALLAPIAILITGGVLAVVAGTAHWAPTGQVAGFDLWAWPAIFAVNVLTISLTIVLTEEIGWRGYFLPRLAVLGERRALLLSGLLHGVWHLPVILLTSLYLAEGSHSGRVRSHHSAHTPGHRRLVRAHGGRDRGGVPPWGKRGGEGAARPPALPRGREAVVPAGRRSGVDHTGAGFDLPRSRWADRLRCGPESPCRPPLHFLIVATIGGGLGEEVGWRGRAQPRLQKHLRPVPANLVLGLIWAVWHLPLWIDPNSSYAAFPFAVYTSSTGHRVTCSR